MCSLIGILGLFNAKGCRCCLVLDSAAADQSCREWAPAGLALIPPSVGGLGREEEGCWCFAQEQSVFYSATPLKVEPFTDFACGEHLLILLLQPFPRFLGQSARSLTDRLRVELPPPPTTTTTTSKAPALHCSLPRFPISECASRQWAVTYQCDTVQLSLLRSKGISTARFIFTCFYRRHALNTQSMRIRIQRKGGQCV